MAKTPKNAEKFPIKWNSVVVGGENQGDSIPSNETIIWGDNPYTWGDVNFVIEVADGLGTGSRRSREARLDKFDDEKKKKLIHLICRVKGEKVYDEKKEVGDMKIKLDDADLVINEVLGTMKVSRENRHEVI